MDDARIKLEMELTEVNAVQIGHQTSENRQITVRWIFPVPETLGRHWAIDRKPRIVSSESGHTDESGSNTPTQSQLSSGRGKLSRSSACQSRRRSEGHWTRCTAHDRRRSRGRANENLIVEYARFIGTRNNAETAYNSIGQRTLSVDSQSFPIGHGAQRLHIDPRRIAHIFFAFASAFLRTLLQHAINIRLRSLCPLERYGNK